MHRYTSFLNLCLFYLISPRFLTGSKRNNDPLQQSNQAGNELETVECNTNEGTANSYVEGVETDIIMYNQETLQSPNILESTNPNASASRHQKWCSLRLTEVEITKLSTELRKCSC